MGFDRLTAPAWSNLPTAAGQAILLRQCFYGAGALGTGPNEVERKAGALLFRLGAFGHSLASQGTACSISNQRMRMQTPKMFVPRILFGIGLTVALSAVMAAAPLTDMATCASRTSYGSIGAGCQIGDKQFTNFNVGVPGTIPNNWELTFEILSSGTFRVDFA